MKRHRYREYSLLEKIGFVCCLIPSLYFGFIKSNCFGCRNAVAEGIPVYENAGVWLALGFAVICLYNQYIKKDK
jgi:hypothetical protein